jgi:hypothetical protein
MVRWLRNLFAVKPARRPRSEATGVRPRLENLEDRFMPTVTNHGGALLQHVEVQGLYLGSDFANNVTLNNQAGQLEGFLSSIVNSTYLDGLTYAGYGVGRGSYTPGKISLANLPSVIQDSDIQNYVQAYINNGTLAAPDANRLYVVFVQDNVVIQMDPSHDSTNAFLGYHGAFAGNDAFGRAIDIHYAVIAYPGGGVGNAAVQGFSTIDDLTSVTSHEICEAATDPNVGYKSLTFYDDNQGEIGDITVGHFVYVNGYAVQCVSNKNDLPITPASATSEFQESFVLVNGGYLYEHNSAGFTFLTSGIASITDQGIDVNGQAVVDVVTLGGDAYEYHDFAGFNYLGSGVKSAVAGVGVSYVLFNNGALYEYHQAVLQYGQRAYYSYIYSNVAAISAGTDKVGVNMVDIVFTNSAAYEFSDDSGFHYLGYGAATASAGRQGHSELLFQNGVAYLYYEASNQFIYLASNVHALTAGYDAQGNVMIDLVFNNGAAYEYRTNTGWMYLAYGAQNVGKAHAGVADLLFGGYDFQHTAAGFAYIGGAIAAVA